MIYHDPACETWRNALAMIRNSGVGPPERVTAGRLGAVPLFGSDVGSLARSKKPWFLVESRIRVLGPGGWQAIGRLVGGSPMASGELSAAGAGAAARDVLSRCFFASSASMSRQELDWAIIWRIAATLAAAASADRSCRSILSDSPNLPSRARTKARFWRMRESARGSFAACCKVFSASGNCLVSA